MKKNKNGGALATRRFLMRTAAMAGLIGVMPASAQQGGPMETVVVTGYQQSLASAAMAKRSDISFSDSIFAEDIGKFPDSNIAEAMNRIPGVILNKDPSTGEGLQIAIRGLGPSFTKVALNNAPIAVATASGTDSSNANRETDLNMFPGELFSKITVSKSPKADQLEGGAAGLVDMRTRRPFDKAGPNLSYNLRGTANSITNGLGGTAAVIGSDTWETGTFLGGVGVLVGVYGSRQTQYTAGFDDGGGYNTANILTGTNGAGQCPTIGGCDGNNTLTIGVGSSSGNAFAIPAVVPRNVSFTGKSGRVYSYNPTCSTTTGANVASSCNINAYALYDLNPGLGSDTTTALNQLTNALFPRLLRNMSQKNDRWQYNSVVSFEVRPSDRLHFYLDLMGGRMWENVDRTEFTEPTRGGASMTQGLIPADLLIDSSNMLAKSFTGYNAQWGSNLYHYANDADFMSVNTGLSWQATDLLFVEFSANASRSHWLQRHAEAAVVSCPSFVTSPGCTPVDVDGNPVVGAGLPGVVTKNWFDGNQWLWTSNIDRNNPHNYQYNRNVNNGGYLTDRDDKRYTKTYGAHLDLTYGADEFQVKSGFAYDVVGRDVVGGDASTPWQNATCGGFYVSTSTPCDGRPGSLISQQDLYNYIALGPAGFPVLNYKTFESASNFDYYDEKSRAVRNGCVDQNPNTQDGFYFNTTTYAGAQAGCYEERIMAVYGEIDGRFHFLGDQELNYNFGARLVRTRQTITSPFQQNNQPTVQSPWGSNYYSYTFTSQVRTYDAFLPSANLVYKPLEDLLIRASASRTMTRAPLPNMLSISSGSILSYTANPTDGYKFAVSLGNPNLKPYYSTNIDLGVEYYTGKEGYVSVSAFRKFLHGVPMSQRLSETFGDLASYGVIYDTQGSNQLTHLQQEGGVDGLGCSSQTACAGTPVKLVTYYNQPGVQTITGLEFGYTQPFDFVLEDYGLKGFGITNNLTIIDVKQSASNIIVNSDGSAPIHPLGVPHYSYNSTLYFQRSGYSARISYNFRGRYYAGNSGASGICLPAVSAVAGQTTYKDGGCVAGAYTVNAPYSQFDFAGSVRLANLLAVRIPSDPELSIGINNIFRAKYTTYFQWPEAKDKYYLSNQSYSIALRGTF